MYNSQLTPNSLWRHPKTGGLYLVVGVSLCSTNGPKEGKEELVIYWSLKYRRLRHRALEEFLDGRFIPIGGDGKDIAPDKVS